MSKYTTELKNIIKINDGNLETVFTDALTTYPIFDENYRDSLNKKIVKHYYFHEIGFETAERFVFELNRKMEEIMLYYNKLYNSEIEINPLINYRKITSLSETGNEKDNENLSNTISDNQIQTDTESEILSTTGTREDNLTNDTTANRNMNKSNVGSQDTLNENSQQVSGTLKDIKSDTPTSQLLAGEIDGDIYASEVSLNDTTNSTTQSTTQGINEQSVEDTSETDTSNQTQNTSSDLTSETTKTNTKSSSNEKTSSNEQIKSNEKENLRSLYQNDEGITISESELILRYRETFLNIDMDIIKELKPLFMMIL